MERLWVVFVVVCLAGTSVTGLSLNYGNLTDLVSDDVADYNETLKSAETSLEFKPQQNYMNELCNKKRLLHDRNAILMSPWTSKYPPTSQSCIVGVESYAYQNYRFVVTFEKMDLYPSTLGTCQRSRLDLFTGQSVSSSSLISESSGLCGHKTGHESYETSTNFLTLRYVTQNLPSLSKQYFLAVITPFHYGSCRHDEFKCHNGKCIQNNMLCDKYNNCGDNSDEKHCGLLLSIAAIIGIVVGAVVLIAVVIVICVCCNLCCCACSVYESL